MKPINAEHDALQTLLLPLDGFHLVLPQPAVAEIARRPDIRPAAGAARWLVGIFTWRAEQVPLISFELMSGEAAAAGDKSRHVAILPALGDDSSLVYYALELKGIPRPALLTPASLTPTMAAERPNGVIAADTMIAGQRVVVPALEQIERLVGEQLAAVPEG